jgi:hypothetical protein
MIPGTVVLLGSTPVLLAELSDQLEQLGHGALDVALQPDAGVQGQVTAAVIAVRTALPAEPLVLVALTGSGAMVPAIGRALVNAGCRIGAYVFLDADLPGRIDPARIDPVQLGDWPDAPCGYLRTSPERATEVRSARLRGWSVVDLADRGELELPSADVGRALATLLDLL